MFSFKPRPLAGPPFAISYVFLVYLIFPIVSIVEKPLEQMIPEMLLIALFVYAYLTSFRNASAKLYLVLAQIAIVGYFAFRYDMSFVYLAFYTTPVIGMHCTPRETAVSYAGLLAMFAFAGWSHDLLADMSGFLQILPAMLVVLLMPMVMRVGRRSRELRNKLSLANEEIARLSKSEERQRISRDLHDTLGHTLSLITLKSELAEKLIAKNPERAVQEIRDVQMTSRAALKQVRELVSGMSAVTVRDEIVHAKQILAAADISLEVDDEAGGTGTSPAPIIDNMLGMCLREAVTNIVKHSRARTCKIEWKESPAGYVLTVTDDGIGPDGAASEQAAGGNGLKGMRERLKLVNGDLALWPAGGRGTRVRFTVPRVEKSGVTEGMLL